MTERDFLLRTQHLLEYAAREVQELSETIQSALGALDGHRLHASADSAASESVESTLTNLTAEPESCSCSEEAVMARVLASPSMYDALLETEKDDRTCGCRGIPLQVCDECQGVTSAGTAYTESPLFQAGERMAASLRASGCLQFAGHQVGECEARGLSANRKCGPCLVVAEWVDAVAAVAHDKASTEEALELCGQIVAPFRANCMLTKGHQGQHAAMTRWASVTERSETPGGQR